MECLFCKDCKRYSIRFNAMKLEVNLNTYKLFLPNTKHYIFKDQFRLLFRRIIAISCDNFTNPINVLSQKIKLLLR
jgi:hypothetical protein